MNLRQSILRSAIVMGSLALAGCGLPELLSPTPPAQIPASAKRLATVSMLGDTFNGTYLGLAATPYTTFGNQAFSKAVPQWQVDHNAAKVAADLIRTQGRFDTVALTAGSRDEAFQIAASQRADLLIVIRPNEREKLFVTAPYGLYERANPIERDQRCVYAIFIVEAFDANTRQSLGSARGAPTPCQFGHDDDLPFRARFDDYTSGEQLALQQRLDKRVGLALRAALETLGLIR
ncbi:hypothetical protein BH10PSE17_BH10PSE17_29310 [soil metagenome]